MIKIKLVNFLKKKLLKILKKKNNGKILYYRQGIFKSGIQTWYINMNYIVWRGSFCKALI